MSFSAIRNGTIWDFMKQCTMYCQSSGKKSTPSINKVTWCILYFWAIELPNRKYGHVSETVSCIDAKCSIMTLLPSPSALFDYWCSALLICSHQVAMAAWPLHHLLQLHSGHCYSPQTWHEPGLTKYRIHFPPSQVCLPISWITNFWNQSDEA